jgi:hypothetical protein
LRRVPSWWSGKASPRVHTKLFMSSSALVLHSMLIRLFRLSLGPIVAAPREQADAAVLPPRDQSIAIMLDFMDPLRPGGGPGSQGRDAGLDQAGPLLGGGGAKQHGDQYGPGTLGLPLSKERAPPKADPTARPRQSWARAVWQPAGPSWHIRPSVNRSASTTSPSLIAARNGAFALSSDDACGPAKAGPKTRL